MLEGLKRLFGGGSGRSAAAEGVSSWAESRQLTLRSPREGEGLIIDGRLAGIPWRLEWGASQRPYVPGNEMRIRAEIGLGSDLQVLVVNKPLQVAMEKAVFDQYVEGVQTRIDNQTPPEMRWLVMFPKLSGTEMGPLRERYVGIASIKAWLQQWLAGPLGAALLGLRTDAETPFVLMIGRGRLTLRTAMPRADAEQFEAMLALFESALHEARRIAAGGPDSVTPSTRPAAFDATPRGGKG